MSSKAQYEMSTRVALETISAVNSLKGLSSAISASTNEWKTNVAALKSSGDYLDALQAKIKGTGETVELYKQKVAELKTRQEGLDTSTQKGAQKYLQYQKQIEIANRQVASLTAQQQRAEAQQDKVKDSTEKERLGLYSLSKQTETSIKDTESLTRVLEAQGAKYQAQKTKLTGLTDTHEKMSTQLKAERQMLNYLGDTYGNMSGKYATQSSKVKELTAKYAENEAEIKTLRNSVGNYSDRMVKVKDVSTNATASIKRGWESIKGATTTATVAIAAATAALVSGAKKASTLQNTYKVTSNLLVTGGEKAAEATKLVAQMQKDGASYSVTYGKSQASIAEQYQELVKRGYTAKEAIGAMKSELQASVASGDDFSDVVKVSSQTLDSFNMRTNNTAKMTANTKKVVNELAYSADMTATSFQSLGVGMSYVGDTAQNSGISLAETSAALGELSNHGLEADKAGTGLRKVLVSLAKDVKNIGTKNDVLTSIGISKNDLVDANGNLKTLSQMMEVINSKTKDMGTQQKNAVFNSLFGTTGQQAGIILAQNNGELEELAKKVEKAGESGTYVQRLADKNSKTAQQSEKRWKQAWENLTTMFGAKLLPYMTDTANDLSKLFADKKFVKTLESDADKVGEFAENIYKAGVWASEHTGEIKTFAKAVASIWVISKVTKFAKATEDLFSILKIGKTRVEEETEQVNIEADAYANLAKQKEIAASAGSTITTAASETESAATSSATSTEVSSAVSSVESTATKSSKWNLLGSSVAARIINGAGLALTAWDVGTSISKAVTSNSASAKYTAGGKTAGTLIGGGIGAMLGGPAGAMIGATLGDQIGGSTVVQGIIKKFVKNWNANIGTVKLKSPKVESSKSAYSELTKAQKKYYSNRAKLAESDNKLLLKEGYITQQQYNSREKTIEKYTAKEKTIANMSNSQQLKLSKSYAKEKQAIEKSYQSQEEKLLTKYNREKRYAQETSGNNSVKVKKIIAAKKKAIDKLEEKEAKAKNKLLKQYTVDSTNTERKSSNKITKLLQTSSQKQKSILKKLANDSKNINANNAKESIASATKDYNEVVKLADKKYKKVVSLAKKQYDSVKENAEKQQKSAINSATDTYNKTVKAAENQYKGNSDYAKKQREKIEKEASKQYEKSVESANNQYTETVSHAKKQYEGTKESAEKQRTDVTDKAEKQKTKVVESASNQSKGVLGHAVKQANGSMDANSKQASGTTSIWNKISSWWNSLAKDFGVEEVKSSKGDFTYNALSVPAYANGTEALTRNQLALVGEAGAELAYKPYSGQVRILGANGAEFTQLQKGEMVLNAEDTKRVISGNYQGTLPAYASGTSSLSSFISSVKSGASSIWNNVTSSALDLLDTIKNPIKYLTNMAENTFDLTSVANVGSVAQDYSKGVVNKSIAAIGDVLQKLIDNESGSADPSGTGVKRWTSDVKLALAKVGLDTSDTMVNAWLKQISTESGGDPKAIQKVKDVNSASGDLAKGLLQVISSTFKTYKLSGHDDIWNGYDNMLAAMNYAKHRYGSKMLSTIGKGHGYANGGEVSVEGLYPLAEGGKTEYVIPTDYAKHDRAVELLNQAKTAVTGTGLNDSSETLIELSGKFDKLLTMFDQLLSLNSSQLNVMSSKKTNNSSLYSKMGLDQQIANFQAIGG